MPKASKEETLKKKIQARALLELGKYTQIQIAQKVGITDKTLRGWINEDPDDIWKVRDPAENRIYDAQKIVQKEKILKQFKKEEEQIKNDIITKQAIQTATEEALVLINLEKERNKLTKEILESAYVVNQYIIDLVKKGQTAKLVEEDIVSFGGVKTGFKKQTKTVEEHKIPDVVRASELLTKQLYGLGVLQTTPTVAIQTHNTNINTQNNDTHTQENSILSEYASKYMQEKQKLAPTMVEVQEA